jgi:hypothetical protein
LPKVIETTTIIIFKIKIVVDCITFNKKFAENLPKNEKKVLVTTTLLK